MKKFRTKSFTWHIEKPPKDTAILARFKMYKNQLVHEAFYIPDYYDIVIANLYYEQGLYNSYFGNRYLQIKEEDILAWITLDELESYSNFNETEE